jgi:hypothetical protein
MTLLDIFILQCSFYVCRCYDTRLKFALSMKNNFRLLCFFLFGIQFLIGCNFNLDEEVPVEPSFSIETISAENDEKLNNIIKNNIGYSTTGKVARTLFGDVNLEMAVKITDYKRKTTRYSLFIENSNNPLEFINYIIKYENNVVSQYVMSYYPDKDWLENNNMEADLVDSLVVS